uniref:Uncharacterized protein n=1 Tax=Romanomermis culicivorax TaxID=13658 RepID=A0A915L076_ROMCU
MQTTTKTVPRRVFKRFLAVKKRNYVAATIAKFPRKIKGRVKMRIMEILLQAEEETEVLLQNE